jgi:hypothetical protein
MKHIVITDKFVIIISVLIIAMYAMYTFKDGSSENIVTAAISGLFGMAVGKSLHK